jgi:Ni/Co efflux regulator RcnB
MKRIILAAVAAVIFIAPAAEAAERRHAGPEIRHGQRFDPPVRSKADSGQAVRRTVKKMPGWHAGKGAHWTKGRHLPNWQRQYVVRDFHRHGLRRPAWGEQWVKVGNDYLLISIRSGVIRLVIGR